MEKGAEKAHGRQNNHETMVKFEFPLKYLFMSLSKPYSRQIMNFIFQLDKKFRVPSLLCI